MSINYQIINSEKLLREFIDWLPELRKNEKYYISLLARNKYLTDKSILKADKISLHRFTSDKKFLLRKIKKLEVPFGTYTQDNTIIPQSALALYITPNPRDLEVATKESLIQFAKIITQPYNGYDPQALVLSNIQKSCGRKIYMDFDYDGYSAWDLKDQIESVINSECLTYLQTRGGFHLLVEIAKINISLEKIWYKHLKNILGCDVVDVNGMIPIPGCVQGEFTPYFWYTE